MDTLESVIAWKPLADLNYPHAFMPAVGKIDGMIFVIGGGQKKVYRKKSEIHFIKSI